MITKNKKQLFLCLFVLLFFLFYMATSGSSARETCKDRRSGYCIETEQALVAQAQIPGLEFLPLGSGAKIEDVLPAIYTFGLGLVGISALVMLIIGGMMYMSAGDSQDQTKRARSFMGNAIWGLVLALLSWLILYTINPDLVTKLKLNSIRQITPAPSVLQDESGRAIGTPGSSVPIGAKGQTINPVLLNQCPLDKGCKLLETGVGTIDCDCTGEFRGQGGL